MFNPLLNNTSVYHQKQHYEFYNNSGCSWLSLLARNMSSTIHVHMSHCLLTLQIPDFTLLNNNYYDIRKTNFKTIVYWTKQQAYYLINKFDK